MLIIMNNNEKKNYYLKQDVVYILIKGRGWFGGGGKGDLNPRLIPNFSTQP